jgi:hypothetical protein
MWKHLSEVTNACVKKMTAMEIGVESWCTLKLNIYDYFISIL